MATTWNPSDKSASITLSNGNHTATSVAGGNNGVRATPYKSISSGKFYIEFSNLLNEGGSGSFGFARSADSLGSEGRMGVQYAGNLYATGVGSVSMGSTAEGKHVSFAIDFANGRMWARYDGGTWVGNGVAGADPATNTNGFNISTLADNVTPHTWLQNNPGTCDLNAGDRAFTYSAPSGFVAWDSTPPPEYFRATLLCYSPRERGFVGYRGGKRR